MIDAFADSREEQEQELRRKLRYLAWRKYGIPRADGDDVVQSAFVAYLEVRERYSEEPNQLAILYGIFRNKCREFLDRRRRERDRLRKYADQARDSTEPILTPGAPVPGNGVDDNVIQSEEGERILAALDELRPEAREMLLLFAEVGRQELLERLELNKNTLDSRLHIYRKEFRRILRRLGVRSV
jgi:RNA polymerase sigma factor (sigma-70 family)